MVISREQLQVIVNEITLEFGKTYLNLIEDYKGIKNNEDYSEKYKESKRIELVERVKVDREKAYKKALEVVSKEREKFEEEKKADEKLSLEEKTLKALEKNNLIQLTMLRVKGAPVETIREILEESNFDNDVKIIVQAELSDRARGENGLSSSETILSRELRHTKDIFSVVESNIKAKMLEEDKVYVSLGNVRSIEKDFDIIVNHNYFSSDGEEGNYFIK